MDNLRLPERVRMDLLDQPVGEILRDMPVPFRTFDHIFGQFRRGPHEKRTNEVQRRWHQEPR